MATHHPLFIYRYMDRTIPQKDSKRFRTRLAAALDGSYGLLERAADELALHAGIAVPHWNHNKAPRWDKFFSEAPLPEVLTAISVLLYACPSNHPWGPTFRQHVDRALREENLGFRIDAEGAIHYAVDEEFVSARAATLAILDSPALAAARAAYEDAFRHMDAHPPDTKAALRSAFEGIEIVAKQLCPPHKNLHAGLCKGELKEKCLAANQGDAVEKRVLAGMFDGMAEWVSAMHTYRHGQPDNFSRPTDDFTVFALSMASAYLRLLAQVAVKVSVQPTPA